MVLSGPAYGLFLFCGVVIAEIFVLPGFGVAGAAGILCILAGLYLTLVDFTVPE